MYRWLRFSGLFPFLLFFCGCGGNFIQGISERSNAQPVSINPAPKSTLKATVTDGPLSTTRVRLVSLVRGTLATGKSNTSGEVELSVLRSVIQSLPNNDRLFLYADSEDQSAAVHFDDGSLRLLKPGQARLKSILPDLSVIKAISTTELTNSSQVLRSAQVSHFSNALSILTETHLQKIGVLSQPLRPGVTLEEDNLPLFNTSLEETEIALNAGSPLLLARFKLLSMANKAIIEEEFKSFLEGAPDIPISSSDFSLSQLSANGNTTAPPLNLSTFFLDSLPRLSEKIQKDLESDRYASILSSSIPLERISTFSSSELIELSTAPLSAEIEARVDQSVRDTFILRELKISGDSGDLAISAQLLNPLSQPVSFNFQYSMNGGQSFTTSSNLLSLPEQISSTANLNFTWESFKDTQIDTDALWIQLGSVYKGKEATALQIGPLNLFNLPNRKPVIANLLTSLVEGILEIQVDISDADNDQLSIDFEYSLDGGLNYVQSQNLSSALQSLTVSNGFGFSWNSTQDFQTNETDVLIRLTVSDPESEGNSLVSSSFIILNRPNTSPLVENLQIQGNELDILISMDVVDLESDTVSIGFEYTTDLGSTFLSSLNLSRSLSSVHPGTGITFIWNSFQDIVVDEPVVRIRLSPQDYNLSGDSFLSDPFPVENQPNRAPALSDISVLPQDEDFAVSLIIQDLDGDQVDLLFEYSLNGGDVFQSTSNFSPQTLSFSPGVAGWTWRSGEDFSTNETSVVLRITPNDGFVDGTSLLSDPISASNNDLPEVSNLQVSGSSDLIGLVLDLTDEDGDSSTLSFEYSLDGGSNWIESTNVSSDQVLLFPLSGLAVQWNSLVDFTSDETDVRVRFIPSDGKEIGLTGTSSLFSVFNNQKPVAQNATVTGTSGDLIISVDVQQLDTDPVSLDFEYSLDAGISWNATLNLNQSLSSIDLETNPSTVLSQETIVFTWHSSQDFTTDETGVMVRIIPSDAQSIGTTAISDLFSVLNNHTPIAHSLITSGSSEEILVSVQVSDEDSDTVDLQFEYSLDAGVNWTSSQNLDQSLTSILSSTSLTFTWFSSQEFTTDETRVQLRLTPSDGKSQGESVISSLFSVFNNYPPEALNMSVIGTSASILVSVDLVDGNSDLLSLQFEYTTDSGSNWILSQNVDRSLTSVQPLSATTFLWNSLSDFRTDETSIQIRLIPSDGKTEGASATSNLFSVFNNHPPEAQNLTVSGTSGDIDLSVDISDEDTDSITLNFEYSLDGGSVWNSSSFLDPSLSSLVPESTYSFTWFSSQNFTSDETMVRVRFTPDDSKSTGDPVTSDLFSVLNNFTPVAHSLEVTGSTTDILVGVYLSDANSDPLTFIFEYSLDAGFKYLESTNLSPLLSSYPPNETTTFLWNSLLDFESDESLVQLRIIPSDGKSSGVSAISSVFSVFNNDPPVAESLTTTGNSNDILISVDLSDGNSDLLSLSFEYTTNGSSFLSSTNVTPTLSGLSPLAQTTFLWNSYMDFTRDQTTVQVRITPSDGKTTGTSAISSEFSVFNNNLPVATDLSLSGSSGTLVVNVDLADSDEDLLSLDFEHSLDDGASWNETVGTTALTGMEPLAGTTFPWDSSQDFSTDETRVLIRLRASDSDGFGEFTTSSSVHQVLNSTNQAPSLSDLRINGNSGAIVVEFSLSDAESDPMSLLFEFSSDGGSSFSTSTNSSHDLSSSLNSSFSKFIWHSSRDLSGDESSVQIRLTPSDQARTGSSATTGPFSVFNSSTFPIQSNLSARTLMVPSFRIDSMVPNPQDNDPDTAGQTAVLAFNREIDTTSFAAFAPLTWNGSNTAEILADSATYDGGKFTIFKNLSFQQVRELEAIVDSYITESVPNTDALTQGFSQFVQANLGSHGVFDNTSTASYSFAPTPFCAVSNTGPCTSVVLGGVLFTNYNRTDHFTFFFMPSLSIERSDGLTDYTGNFLTHAVQGYGATTVPISTYFPLGQGSMRQLHAPTSSDFVFDSQGSLFIPSSAVKTDIKSIPINPLSSLGIATIPSTSTVFSRLASSYYSPELLAIQSTDILTIQQILFSDGDGVVNEALNYIAAKDNAALFEHGSVKLGEVQYYPPFFDLPTPTDPPNHIMRPILMSSSEILSASPFSVTSVFIGESITFSVIESFTAADFSTKYWQKDARLTYQNFYPTLSVSYGDTTTIFTDVLEIRRWRSVTPVVYITATSSWSQVPTTGTTTGLVEELVSWFARDAGVIIVDDTRYKSSGAQIFREEVKEVIGALDIVDGFEWNKEVLPR